MKRPFAATVWREGRWYVSQCLELDVASQGDTEEEALANLKEALELHFEPPASNQAARCPDDRGRGWGRLSPNLAVRSSAGLRRPASSKQKGSHVKFVRRAGDVVDTAIVPQK